MLGVAVRTAVVVHPHPVEPRREIRRAVRAVVDVVFLGVGDIGKGGASVKMGHCADGGLDVVHRNWFVERGSQGRDPSELGKAAGLDDIGRPPCGGAKGTGLNYLRTSEILFGDITSQGRKQQ